VKNPREAGTGLRSFGSMRRATGFAVRQHSEVQVVFGASARGHAKHVRGGDGKPSPRRRKGEPQRGKRQEGTGVGFTTEHRLRGGINPSKPPAQAEFGAKRHGRKGAR
jgi:hypothetical protein